MKKHLNNDQIADRLLASLEVENDNQLAKALGVERQQIRQFRDSPSIRLNQVIMSVLIEENEKLKAGAD
ncbi:hypothetical protein BM525_19880 (plasmid) [Alteromonas mediterranea]|uniref:Uncharacterized protein n=1 Tax=Alteromonas mediterranea TaxID=314275 RepID=A0AAC9JDT4_9ALTE|nr:hypothetical protein [Alteromonas mediterranea]APD92144.1 hypothetical protein BM524_19685 [Alteromonas mediterranea]APD99998.1 hypothetical protein BM525_19880 [Alteromonas mediterranea]